MQKLKFRSVVIEITRKCNLQCAHCMRGEAQDLTISQDILDNFFSQVKAIDTIYFSGGEPLLEIDTIDYVVDYIAKYNVDVKALSLISNGTINDERILEVYEKFISNGIDRTADMTISDDKFHDLEKAKKSHQFYKNRNRNKNIIIADFKPPQKSDTKSLKRAGRAVNLISKNQKTLIEENYYIRQPILTNHRIKIDDDGFIGCAMNLSANGNLGYHYEVDYDSVDSLSFGNIQDKAIRDLIDDFNDKCLLTCKEVFAQEEYLNPAVSGLYDKRVVYPLLVCSLQLRYVEYVRSMLVDKYKITAEEAIKKFPYINDNVWFDEISHVIDSNTDEISKLAKKENYTYLDAATLWIHGYMDKFINGERLRPYYLFGQIEDVDKIVAHRRSQLKDIKTEGQKNE